MARILSHSRLITCGFLGVLLMTCWGCATSSYTPYLTSVTPTTHPMVAQYSVTHYRSGFGVWVEFGPDTNYGRQTSVVSDSVPTAGSAAVNVLVAGMLPNTTYHMRAHVHWANGDTWVDQDHTFKTGALPTSSQLAAATGYPDPLPTFSVIQPSVSGSSPAPGVELFSFAAPLTVVSDLNGNIIWYCPIWAIPIKQLPSGHFLVNPGSDLQEMDLTCKTVRDVSRDQVNQSLQANGYDFTIPPPLGLGGGNPFHHDMLALPNGHWIALCQITKDFDNLDGVSGTTQVVGDALVDIDPTGNVVWAWSSFDHLDVTRYPYFGLPDWTHSNALVYTPDGNLLLSMRAQSWILKIDYANGTGTGNILWKLGAEGDFSLVQGDPSLWFYSQHYPTLLSTTGSVMQLLVYDNGNFRTYSDGSVCGSPVPGCFSRATIFEVDESTRRATLLWQDLPGLFSLWGGSIEALSNGNIEFDNTYPLTTTLSQITEVTQTDNPQVVWQMVVSGQAAYRGNRIPSLYSGVTWKK